MAPDTTMDVDMDMDLDFEADDDLARIQAEAARINALPSMAMDAEPEHSNGNGGVEEGEVAPIDIVATKVHIQGVEDLNTNDIENFAREHSDGDLFQKVEWVNDSSANLIYDTAQAASDALKTLSNIEVDNVLEPRQAKPLSTHPHLNLEVRMALVTDQKIRGAAAHSRYYLLHPEADPDNRMMRGRGGGRARGRGRRGGGGYGSRRDRSGSRRSSNAEPFDVNLYDDDPASVAARRPPQGPASRRSYGSEEDLFDRRREPRSRRRDEDLFAGRSDGRLRDRSASPTREGDGRYGFSDDQPHRETARYRSPPPLRRRSDDENRRAREAMKADLFPDKKRSTALSSNGYGPHRANPNTELFSKNVRKSGRDEDLFPEKIHHKRQDAKNLHPNEVASVMGQRSANSREKPRDLFSRIDANSTAGRLNAVSGGVDKGFSIKGAGAKNEISFLGASKNQPVELFPKAGGGQDLFEHKIRGRRKGAADFM